MSDALTRHVFVLYKVQFKRIGIGYYFNNVDRHITFHIQILSNKIYNDLYLFVVDILLKDVAKKSNVPY